MLLAWRLRRGDSSAAVFDLRKGGVRQTGVLRSLRRAAAIGLAAHQEGCQRFGHADDGAWGGDRRLQGLWTKRPPPTPQASRMKGRQRSLSGVGKYVSPPSRADPEARRRSLCRTGPRRARLFYPDGRAAWAGRWLGPRASSKPGVSPHQPCGHAPPSAAHPEVPSVLHALAGSRRSARAAEPGTFTFALPSVYGEPPKANRLVEDYGGPERPVVSVGKEAVRFDEEGVAAYGRAPVLRPAPIEGGASGRVRESCPPVPGSLRST